MTGNSVVEYNEPGWIKHPRRWGKKMNRSRNLLTMMAGCLVGAMGLSAPLPVPEVKLPLPSPEAKKNWPQFRGPTGDGHAQAVGLPLRWSETENIVWKTAIHDRGWSSPVVWEDQVWLTTATPDGKRLFAVCVDWKTGKTIHDVLVFEVAAPEHVAAMNSYASPTPVIEAGRVYVHYGTYGTACLDTRTGKVLWKRNDLNCDHHEGPGASPILWENLLIFHVDGCDVQYGVALDKNTGRTVWKTPRGVDYRQVHRFCRKSFCTPLIVEVDGQTQLISPVAKAIFGYDPRTGEERWKIRYNGWSVTPRPVCGLGLVFFVNDYERPEFWAVRPGGQGDLTATNVAWKITRGMPAQPSPLLIDDLLYLVNDDGIAQCLEARTGKSVWRERLAGRFSASPLYADGRLYFFSHDARGYVLRPGRRFEVLAVNSLEGSLMASPATVGRALLLRTEKNLYRLEETAR